MKGFVGLFVLALATASHAEVRWSIDPSLNGKPNVTGIPDIAQQGPTCGSAAYMNLLWHFSNKPAYLNAKTPLIPHKDPKDVRKEWNATTRTMMLSLADTMYGKPSIKTLPDGSKKEVRTGGRGVEDGLFAYLKSVGHGYSAKNGTGLSLRRNSDVNLGKMRGLIDANQVFTATWNWPGEPIGHYLSPVGYEQKEGATYFSVTNGWQGAPNEHDNRKEPVDPTYYDLIKINGTNGNQLVNFKREDEAGTSNTNLFRSTPDSTQVNLSGTSVMRDGVGHNTQIKLKGKTPDGKNKYEYYLQNTEFEGKSIARIDLMFEPGRINLQELAVGMQSSLLTQGLDWDVRLLDANGVDRALYFPAFGAEFPLTEDELNWESSSVGLVLTSRGSGLMEGQEINIEFETFSQLSEADLSAIVRVSSFDGTLTDYVVAEPVPEPATLVGLALGAVSLVRRRKRA